MDRLTRLAKSTGVPVVLVGHVTKDGDLAGPRAVEHLVDTVLSFDGDRHHSLRVLTAVKHRFGPAGEVGIFEMRDDGLRAVPDPGPMLLGDRMAGIPGSVVVPVLQGRRPLLVEVQALLGPERRRDAAAHPGHRRRPGHPVAGRSEPPHRGRRRGGRGLRGRRGRHQHHRAGGRPGCGLAVASAAEERVVPSDLVVFGELGLAGEVRMVPGADRRLAEAWRAGFTRALVPALHARPRPSRPAWTWCRVRTLAEALAGTIPRVVDRGSQPLNDALALIAPGTALREGLDRILQAKHGALIVLGDDPDVLSICTGGFLLDAEYSPQRLSELAKMDGAIILAGDASRIARANVHLVPKSSIATTETGTRHRTAERVARSIDVPVIAVSEAMATIAVYRNDLKHTSQSSGWLIDRSSQALATQQRFRMRFDDALTHADPARDGGHRLGARRGGRAPAGRNGAPDRRGDRGSTSSSWARRAPDPPADRGAQCRGERSRSPLVLRDYAGEIRPARTCATLPPTPSMDLPQVVAILGLPAPEDQLHAEMAPRGYRLLHRLPQLSPRAGGEPGGALRHPARNHVGHAWPNSSRSRASARPRPGRCATGWPAWSRPASSSGTNNGRIW